MQRSGGGKSYKKKASKFCFVAGFHTKQLEMRNYYSGLVILRESTLGSAIAMYLVFWFRAISLYYQGYGWWFAVEKIQTFWLPFMSLCHSPPEHFSSGAGVSVSFHSRLFPLRSGNQLVTFHSPVEINVFFFHSPSLTFHSL